MLLAFRAGDRAIFLFGFAKNVLENIDNARLAKLRIVGASYLTVDEATLRASLENGDLIEVHRGEEV